MPATEFSDALPLRHALATLAYRAAKTLRDAPPGFANFRAGPTTRTAVQILAHMGDLLDWALSAVNGKTHWQQSQPKGWDEEVARFFAALQALDDRLAQGSLACSPQKIFQGPIAGALTHVGQLATLRRLAGSGIRGENYFVAEISAGRVGIDQPAPIREFD
ncbi:MAG TPA: hypothetical protein VFE46_10600 [Pirellulales bacterium]|jgi:hypothetical protein|nr:hypothetical protein [Pirellulales bacterium]